MKVLFIGEGPHDIGHSSLNPREPRPARGVVPTLARRICAEIGAESIAFAWREIGRYHPSGQRRGYSAKVAAAALLAVKSFDCGATVIVAGSAIFGAPGGAAEGIARLRAALPA